MESSVNLHNFKKLNPVKQFPDFRRKAITEKFIEHLTKVCDILKAFQYKDIPTLDQPYDVRHLLEILDIEDWRNIPPFEYYL